MLSGYGQKWHQITPDEEKKLFFPTLMFKKEKALTARSKFSPKMHEDFYWLLYPNQLEFRQYLRVTIYCSFDFSPFPFDFHTCNFSFGVNFWSDNNVVMKPAMIIHGKDDTMLGKKPIQGV